MSLANKVTGKIQRAADKIGPLDTRKVYKRVRTETGGDSLIGRGTTLVVTDTAFTRQPLFARTGKRAELLSTTNNIVTPFDYEFTFTPDQMTSADVQNPNIVIVIKDTAGHTEVLELSRCLPLVLNGTEAAVSAIYRSVSR